MRKLFGTAFLIPALLLVSCTRTKAPATATQDVTDEEIVESDVAYDDEYIHYDIPAAWHKGTSQVSESKAKGTKTYTYGDSCKFTIMKLSIELPTGTDEAAQRMRDSLIRRFEECALMPLPQEEEEPRIQAFSGNASQDPLALVEYYGKAVYDLMLNDMMNFDDLMYENLQSDMESAEPKEQSEEDDESFIPMWGYYLNITKETEAKKYVVYHTTIESYLGGAHGSYMGPDALTFDRKTGKKVVFILPEAEKSMQALLMRGLKQYYSDNDEEMSDEEIMGRLMLCEIDNGLIPLPQDPAYPNAKGDSLLFVYGQYEIACYADGMPSFALPVKELLPYLTNEGKALLNK